MSRRRRGALPSRQSVVASCIAGEPVESNRGTAPACGGIRLATLGRDAAEALSPHARPDAGAAGGARGDRRAGDPPPLARLQGGLPGGARAPARGLPDRERGARLHRLRHRRLRVGRSSNLLSPGEKVLVVSHGEFGTRWQKMAAAFGCDVVPLTYEWGETPARRRRRARARPRAARRSRSSSTRRRRPASSPTSARSSPPATTPARSRSSTRSRASARFRSRPTPGGSTSSSPARRRR